MSTFTLGIVIFLIVFGGGLAAIFVFGVIPALFRERKDAHFRMIVADAPAFIRARKDDDERFKALETRLEEAEKRFAEIGNDIQMLYAISARRPGRKKPITVRFSETDDTASRPYTILSFMGQVTYVVAITENNEKLVFPDFRTGVSMPLTAAGVCFAIDTPKGKLPGIIMKRNAVNDPYVIAHECWHLFCNILKKMNGQKEYTIDLLNDEVYVYSFSALFKDVYEAYQVLYKTTGKHH